MQRKRYLLIMLPMLLFLCGCMQNDGHIGPIFGSWKVVDVKCEGMTPPQMDADRAYFWQFQGNVIRCSSTRNGMQAGENFGQYRLMDNTLYLDFSDTKFYPPLGLPRVCELQVLELNHSRLTVVYHPTDDSSEIIYLKKW